MFDKKDSSVSQAGAQSFNNIVFSIGRKAEAVKTRRVSESWSDFVCRIKDYAEGPAELNGSETKEQYDRYKKRLNYIAAQFNGDRGNDTAEQRSVLFIDVDGVEPIQARRVKRAIQKAGYAAVAYTTTGHLHSLKDKDGEPTESWRFLIPTNRPIDADDIWQAQHALYDELGLTEESHGIDFTACQRARIMFAPAPGATVYEIEGKPARRNALLNREIYLPSESGNTVWSEESLANANENSQAIAGWAFEMGLEMMSSGRGWAIQCPNHMAHSSNDGTDGSTAILLPDSLHPEVRFNCQHDHCRGLNSHQHLTLQLCGVPDSYLPEAHNISKKQLTELLPFMDVAELESVHRNQVDAAEYGHACNDDDLADEIEFDSVPLIPGWLHSHSTWEYTAKTGSFKTFQILNMMAASAAGHPFAGADTVKAHHFLFDAEGGIATRNRIEALERMYGQKLPLIHVIPYDGIDTTVTTEAGVKNIIRLINKLAGGEQVGIVAFDTLNRTFARKTGFKSASDGEDGMGGVVTTLKAIQVATGGAVGVISHPNKSATDRTAAGSMALRNGVDYSFYSERNEKKMEINFWHEKAKHVEEITAPGMRFIAQVVELRANPHPATHNQECRFAPVEGLRVVSVEPNDMITSLFIAPIAYAPFEGQAAEAGREAVQHTRKPKVLTDVQQWVHNLIENNEPLTLSEIKGLHSRDENAPKMPYGGVTTVVNRMLEAGHLHAHVDERGVKDNTYHIDTRRQPPVPVNEDDLEDLA